MPEPTLRTTPAARSADPLPPWWTWSPPEHINWIREFWPDVERFTDGFDVNDLELEAGASAIQAKYRGNHRRLVEVKNRYDPENLFRLNANIEPSVRRDAG